MGETASESECETTGMSDAKSVSRSVTLSESTGAGLGAASPLLATGSSAIAVANVRTTTSGMSTFAVRTSRPGGVNFCLNREVMAASISRMMTIELRGDLEESNMMIDNAYLIPSLLQYVSETLTSF
jgi:hypothetical protein